MTAPTPDDQRAASSPTPAGRPWTGVVLALIAVLHLAATPLFFADAAGSIIKAGVVASVDADPAVADLRNAGFWYVTAGLSLTVLSAMTIWVERQVRRLPRFFPWLLLGIALWGILLTPASGFWLFLAAAAAAYHDRKRSKTAR